MREAQGKESPQGCAMGGSSNCASDLEAEYQYWFPPIG